ncbi:MAG: LysM peptidoglycan-binding domain-containing protein [Proteobacteria bacterium]|nr:LysM peptidoglycan-binding domain-containing protein [Pseudomonadota bacterium]
MEYKVQRGDTIAHVSKVMGSDWQTLKRLNPQAVGRSKANGNWFVREGAVLADRPKSAFGKILKTAEGAETGKNKAVGSSNGQEHAGIAKVKTHTLKAGETVWALATKTYHVNPEDILKANNITDPRSLQIGRTLSIPVPHKPVGKEEVVASWYGRYHHGLPMANGEPFDMNAPTIAHKNIPLGTRVLLENPETGQKATATVTDRGPYIQGRDVDLSYKLAQRLSLDKQGVGNLTMQVL